MLSGAIQIRGRFIHYWAGRTEGTMRFSEISLLCVLRASVVNNSPPD